MVQPLPSSKPTVLKQLACPSCGGPLPQYTPGAQTLICPRCNSYITLDMEGLHDSGKGSKLPPPPAPIKLGQTFTVEGASYLILGRVLYEGWDDEDRWQWTEWLLGSSDGRLLWLSYDQEDGFVLFNKMRIRQAFNPLNDSTIPTSDGKQAHIRERYPAKIVGAEGELTFKAMAGSKLNMIEGAGFGKEYSIQQTASELEVYEGKTLPPAAVATALNDPSWATRLKRQDSSKQVYRLIGGMALLFTVIALALAVWANSTGETAFTKQVTLNTKAPSATIPVNFVQGDRPALVKLWLVSSIPLNTFAEVEVSVTSPDEKETFVFEKEFWYETGVEEGERWTERDDYGSDVFVPHLTGEHDIEVSLGENNVTGDVVVKVAVLRNHILPSFFLIYGVVLGVIGCIFFVLGLRGGKG